MNEFNIKDILLLIRKANESGLILSYEDDQLRLDVLEGTAVDQEILKTIKLKKQELIQYFQSYQQQEPISSTEEQIRPTLRETFDRLPLSFAQERLWFVDQLQGGLHYHVSMALRIHGPVDQDAMERSLRSIIDRHETLRTVFIEEEGEVFQQIRSSEHWQMVFESWEEKKSQQEQDALIKTFINQPFKLAEDYPIRVQLIRQAHQEYILILVMHHIVADGWSLPILVNEWVSLYHQYKNQQSAQLPPLPIQYADYAIWQRQQLAPEHLAPKLAYWENQLANLEPLQLPTDFPRPAIQSTQGGRHRMTIPTALYQQLVQYSQQEEVTLYMLMMAAFKLLLHKYSGQNDICIGSPVANRTQGEVSTLIGFFVNSLVLRSQINGQMPFSTFLQEVKRITLEAYQHQEVPFEKIVEQLEQTRDTSRHPLYQVVFLLQNQSSIPELQIEDWELSEIPIQTATSKFDLQFSVIETGKELEVMIEYCSDLFLSTTIEQMTRHYRQLLFAIAETPHEKMARLQMLSVAEVQDLLSLNQNLNIDFPLEKTIVDVFEEQVARFPNRPALVFEDHVLTYQALEEKANQLAHYLHQTYSFEVEEPVLICLPRSEWIVVSILAVLKAGGAYVPVDPHYPAERIQFILSDSACRVKIDEELIQRFEQQAATYESTPPARDIQPSSLAYVIYTSGSTGQPKGVQIEHHNVVRLLHHDQPLFDFSEEDTWTLFHSYCFDFSVWEMYGALLFGGKLVVVSEKLTKDFSGYLDLLLGEKVTVLNQTPAVFYILVQEALERSSCPLSLRYVIFGGEALAPSRLKAWSEHFPQTRLINMYGITETTVHVTYKAIDARAINQGISNIGRPMPTLSTYVLDADQNLQPIGVAGELYVGGAGVARAYLNRPQLTKERFIEHPSIPDERLYRSGDQVKLLPNGDMEYLGRIDQQVKIRGYRIELGEIEQVLLQKENVDKVVAQVIEGAHPSIAVYLTSAQTLGAAELKQYLKERLPDYMVPAHFIQLEKLPITSNGKIDRRALPLPDGSLNIGRPSYVAARSEIEQACVAIWEELLDQHSIGIYDDFFELGGHSLLITRLINAYHKAFELKLEVKDIFTHTTLAAQAALLEQTSKTSYSAIEPIAESQEGYAISDAQLRMWTQGQFSEGNITSNMPASLPLDGQYDIESFRKAIYAVVERHEILRTVFRPTEIAEIRQWVLRSEELDFHIPIIDLQSSANPQQAAEQYVKEDAYQPFDLANGPLLRARLLKLANDQHIFYFNTHHLISDGWSVNVLSRDVFAYYEAFKNQQLPKLSPLEIQYKDYAAWHLQQLKGSGFEVHKQYWLERFQGELPLINLPSSLQRPLVRNYQARTMGIYLPQNLTSSIRLFCKEQGGTLFMGLLAAMNALFSRYTTEQDFIVGTPIAGREHESLKNQIGFYVNTLALRNQVKAEDGFISLFQRVKATTLDAFTHQIYPFDHLVEDLGIHLRREVSRNAIFDIMVALQSAREIPVEVDLEQEQIGKVIDLGDGLNAFDASFDFHELDKLLFLKIVFNPNVYEYEMLESFTYHFQALLEQMLQHPNQAINKINFLSDREEQQLLVDFNNTQQRVPSFQNIAVAFEEQVRKTPTHTAVVFKDRRLSYHTLNEKANRLAHYLRTHQSATPNSFIGILADRSDHMMIGILGILKSGAAYVPLDPNYPEQRLKFVIEDSGIQLLLTDHTKMKLADRLQWECPQLHTYLCLDVEDAHQYMGRRNEELMDSNLWNHVGITAQDDISGGGWLSSFTGEPFSVAEMKEYAENAYHALQPHLSKEKRILEIGCSSGLTLRELAPSVGAYIGIDLSAEILKNLKANLDGEQFGHVKLKCLHAFDIDELNEGRFDIIVINSVVQCFGGYNYLRTVLKKSLRLLNEEGIIFVGDVMDLDRKEQMIQDLSAFKQAHRGKGYKTKTDFSAELFIPKDFFRDLQFDLQLADVTIRDKVFTLENELTNYRYDALLYKGKGATEIAQKSKYQLGTAVLNQQAIQNLLPTSKAGDLAYLMYTSGSTGNPKGVMIEQASVISFIQSNEFAQFSQEDTFLATGSMAFDVTTFEYWSMLLHGGCLVLETLNELLIPSKMKALIQHSQANIIHLIPSWLSELVENDITLFEHIEILYTGGDKGSAAHINKLLATYPDLRIIHCYGPTENTTFSSTYTIKEQNRILPIGQPKAHSYIYILDDQLQLVPKGVQGEICVGGIGLARGYLNRPLLSEEKFIDDPFRPGNKIYRTGDQGRWQADGHLLFMGRVDEQVKIRGFRIETGEVEFALLALPIIEQAVVVTHLSKTQEKELIAYVVSKQQLDTLELRNQLRGLLPEFMIPTYFIQLSQLPVNANGKIDKKQLPSPERMGISGNKTFVAPSTPMEKKIAHIWQQVLKLENISIEEDFFELGGHSLKAIRIVLEIYKATGIKTTADILFNHSTIAKLAKVLGPSQREAYRPILPVSSQDYYPLSHAQRRLWVTCEMDKTSTAYNMSNIFRLNGEVDIAAFEKTFAHLLERHEILRTNMTLVEGVPMQIIHPPDQHRFTFVYTDLREVTGVEEQCRAIVVAEENRPFDLEKDSLIRVQLIQLQEKEYVLMYHMHHIITDGWSMDNMKNEILLIYKALIKNNKLPLLPLKVQYKDFAHWQNELLESAAFSKHKQFWLDRLKGDLPLLDLPTDYPRPPLKSDEGDGFEFQLDEELIKGLRKFNKANRNSLFVTIITALNILFYHYTKQKDIIIGSPVSGRDHPELENQIGFYINSIVLRNQFDESMSFIQLHDQVKAGILDALSHQFYPFDLLVEDLQLKRDFGRHPVFDVMAQVFNQDVNFDFGTFQIDSYPQVRSKSLYDLYFCIFDYSNGAVHGKIEYDTRLFKESTIEQMKDHLALILHKMVTAEDWKIAELDLGMPDIQSEEEDFLAQMYKLDKY